MTYDFFFVLSEALMKPITLYPHQIEAIKMFTEMQKQTPWPTIVVPCRDRTESDWKKHCHTLPIIEVAEWPDSKNFLTKRDAARKVQDDLIDSVYPAIPRNTECVGLIKRAKQLVSDYGSIFNLRCDMLKWSYKHHSQDYMLDSNGKVVGLEIHPAVAYYRHQLKNISSTYY